MFKIQLWIVWDVVNESEAIKKMKEKIKELEDQKKNNGKIGEKQYEVDVQRLKGEIESSRFTIAALREIVDGIVWRYFDYNRALLYIVADKQPLDLVEKGMGLENALYELGDAFISPNSKAIYNDISNFLRIGDVTKIGSDGTIEFIEVKSSKKRGARFTRQKERMQGTVEFFNTGIKEVDGRQFVINESPVKQRNYLKPFRDSILRAKTVGYDSILIGSHLIIETVDLVSSKSKDENKIFEHFESKHKSVKDKWAKQNDFVYRGFHFEKLEYAKNYAPYTIFPFEDEIIADILIGKTWIHFQLNYSEVIRIIERNGWELVRSIFDMSEQEINDAETKDINLYTVRKHNCVIAIPPSWFGRLCFELMSPKIIVDELNRQFELEPATDRMAMLTNYLDDRDIWN